MSQHNQVIANQAGSAFRSDLNNALAALFGNSSGAAAPTITIAYQWWADTTSGLLKIRNAANTAWVTVGTLESANLGLAALAGSASQTFSVAAPTAAAHAVRADQIQKQSVNFTATTGTSTAYVCDPTPAVAAYTDGLTLDIQPHVTCGNSPVINVSGLGNKGIYRELSSGVYSAVTANEMMQYINQKITYSLSYGGFILRGSNAKRMKLISATRDMTAASGSVAYTGVGFKPTKITAICSVSGTAPNSYGSGNTSNQMCLVVGTSSASSGCAVSELIQIQSTVAGAKQTFVLSSEDVDGFTGTWTKTNTPAAGTADIRFLCEE